MLHFNYTWVTLSEQNSDRGHEANVCERGRSVQYYCYVMDSTEPLGGRGG